MKLFKKFVSVLTILAMTLSLIGFNHSVYATNTDTYISQLIMYYQNYQETATTDIERILDEMAEVDTNQAKTWEKIMNYWSEVNSDHFVNVGTVPTKLPNDDSVAIVILGFALNDDGSMKDELVGRLQTGLDIAEEYPHSYVVVTGGGTAANNPNVTEGGLMGEWLIEQGLDKDRVIIENQAPDTVGNAENTYAILNEKYPNVNSVALVTSDYHVPRGCLLYNSKFILESYENNSNPIDIIANAGYSTGTQGYETISLQANGLRSVAGINAKPTVELSKLAALTVTQNTIYETGNELDLSVTATYNTGYERDVTDLVKITGFDKTKDAHQSITVSYTENGITVDTTLVLSEKSKTTVDTSKLESLIEEAKNLDSTKYTTASYTTLTHVLNDTEVLLDKNDFNFEELNQAYTQLENAIKTLRPRVNIVTYKKNITSNDTGTDDISKIADGKNETYWTSKTSINDLEIVIELDGYYDLEEIVVRPYHKDSDSSVRSYFYDLYVSEDGNKWTLVAQHTAKGTTANGNSHKIDTNIHTKYIKIVGTGKINPGTQTNQFFHLSEVYAYGEETNNIILNKPFTSSGEDTSVASSATAITAKAVDGDRSTYWDAGAYGNKPWLDVDLGEIYSLDSVNVITYVGSGRYYQYEVYASTDGKNYTLIAEKKDKVEPTIYGTTFEFDEPIYASHIKVVGTFNSKNSAFHIAELRAYGKIATGEGLTIVEKQNLKALINNIYRSDYTEESWKLYTPVREKALALISKENASIEELQNMKLEIQNTIKLLEIGNPDHKEEGTFRVASFNIWAPNPKHPDVKTILSELLRCEVDYAGIEEVDKNNTRDNRDVLKLIASDKYEYNFNKSIDYKGGEYGIGQLSSTKILEISGGNYTKTANEEGRSWMRMLVEIDGKEVAIYNTHLSVKNENYPNAQSSNIAEILEIMKADTCKYKILTGDFNATREYMDPFKTDYNLVNGNNGLWYSTFSGDQYSGGLGYLDGEPSQDITSGIDNIVYTRNMEVSNVRVVHNNGLSDHYMIYADFKLLDYDEKLQELVDSLNYIEKNYTKETWEIYSQKLEEAKTLLANTNYTDLQEELKKMMIELQEAVNGLVLVDADYTAVDEAKARIPDDLNIYTEETVKVLNKSLDSIVEGKKVDEQSIVDEYAKAINDAIDKLVLKDANYSAVEKAIEKANALNKDDYKDFSAVEKAVKAVQKGLDITKQAEVDAMAKAIEDAISRLETKDAVDVDKPNIGDNHTDIGDKPNTGDNNTDTGDKPNTGDNNTDTGDKPNTGDNNTDTGDKPNTGTSDKPSVDKPSTGGDKKPTTTVDNDQTTPSTQETTGENANKVKTNDPMMIAPYAILAVCAAGAYVTISRKHD